MAVKLQNNWRQSPTRGGPIVVLPPGGRWMNDTTEARQSRAE
ncbi:MAG TPA: hypothetical protein PKD90_06225 [Phnomibacter sp.]|nr:hypothetical protein [Phnomibacter sp.]